MFLNYFAYLKLLIKFHSVLHTRHNIDSQNSCSIIIECLRQHFDLIITSKNENNLKNFSVLVHNLCKPDAASFSMISSDELYLRVIKPYLRLDADSGLVYDLDVCLFERIFYFIEIK